MSFIMELGTYCYKVMPFGLKNAGATYQRLVNKMFSKQLGETMEVYIDYMLVKSSKASNHVPQLQECFDILNKFGMKLNPTKCTFGVASGEFLGYLVTERGIEANPKQIAALVDTLLPRSVREVQSLTGKIATLNRFISRSTDRCLPFYKLLKGNKKFEWNIECDSTLKELKAYISEPPVLSKPIIGETLFLYDATSEHAVSIVLIREESGEQKPIYYVSRSLVDAETTYPVMEKLALAVVTAAIKLRPYFQSHPIIIMMSLAKWAIELSEYDIEYKPRTSSKAQVLADFVIELVPKEDSSSSNTEKWRLHVDGASSKQGSGIGIQLESPTREMIEQSFRLGFSASNNEAEYESLIAGLRLARSVGAREISAFSDSQLVTSQYHGEYEAKNKRMEAYLSVLQEIAQQFHNFELTKIPRGDNTSADALAALASNSNLAVKRIIPVEGIDKPIINLPCKGIDLQENNPSRIDAITTRSRARRESQGLDNENSDEPDNQSAPNTSRVGTRGTATTAAIPEEAVQETSNETHEAFKKELEARPDWRTPIFKYIKDGELPAERWEARKIKARSSRYCVYPDAPQSIDKYMEPYQNRDQTVQDSSAEVRLPSRTAQDDRAVYRLDRTSTRPSQPSRQAKVNSRARLNLDHARIDMDPARLDVDHARLDLDHARLDLDREVSQNDRDFSLFVRLARTDFPMIEPMD
ncbi:uncharacterized protein LOC106350303 [Brassica napus]|uniref:uncharacterized protein LOC106350303 n=1 Tax=Brassica napus TaxID=3708 RepID=UPI0006AA8024|nr:uncharacterized protein LOC106350303 [Brassica napus]